MSPDLVAVAGVHLEGTAQGGFTHDHNVVEARALYGELFLVVLDEPNANLDHEGEEALTRAILGVRARRGIVVMIAHRPSALAGVDSLLVMRAGRLESFGPKEAVFKQALQPVAAPVRFNARVQGAAS